MSKDWPENTEIKLHMSSAPVHIELNLTRHDRREIGSLIGTPWGNATLIQTHCIADDLYRHTYVVKSEGFRIGLEERPDWLLEP